MSAALAANSGSLERHQNLRPARSIRCARRKRQTCWSLIVAKFLGQQRRGPATGARGRRPVEQRQDAPTGVRAVGLRFAGARRIREPGQTVLGEPHPPSADHAPRAPDLRAIARLPQLSPARSAIRARSASRCSVLPERTQPVSVARSAAADATGVASCIAMPQPHHGALTHAREYL